MYILGISAFFHDSSAALLKNGKIVAAADEERFTRKKHDTSFPHKAIDYCLREADISPENLAAIAFYEKPIRKFERVLSSHIEKFPQSFYTFYLSMPSWIKEKLQIGRLLSKDNLNTQTFFIPHHLCHASSAYFPSPFEKAAIFTIDGVGEWTTTAYGHAEKNKLYLEREIRFPHSVGLLYSTVTAYLGFSVNNSEYKVMGLSAYGKKDRKRNPYYQKLKEVIYIKRDGSYALNMDYFVYHYKNSMPSKAFIDKFGPQRKKNEPLLKRHKDIAASLQLVTEDIYLSILNNLYNKTRLDNVCIAGGVALNSVANGKILTQTPFRKVFIQPHSGDGGTSLRAAFFVYNSIFKNKKMSVSNHIYLGPGFNDRQIEKFLKEGKIKYKKISSRKALISETARLIFENNVVGWFQGRMEWGPRALGARSILANPINPKMQEILNAKVKHREKFRPFAPAVPIEEASKYFETDKPIPHPTDFMLMVYPVKSKWKKKLPSIVHVDGTGRLQTIRKSQNPLYWSLVYEFGKLSKIPILINTSFNIQGEPIVATPYDAYKCMMGTEIDYLVVGSFIVKRKDNLKHAWDK